MGNLLTSRPPAADETYVWVDISYEVQRSLDTKLGRCFELFGIRGMDMDMDLIRQMYMPGIFFGIMVIDCKVLWEGCCNIQVVLRLRLGSGIYHSRHCAYHARCRSRGAGFPRAYFGQSTGNLYRGTCVKQHRLHIRDSRRWEISSEVHAVVRDLSLGVKRGMSVRRGFGYLSTTAPGFVRFYPGKPDALSSVDTHVC